MYRYVHIMKSINFQLRIRATQTPEIPLLLWNLQPRPHHTQPGIATYLSLVTLQTKFKVKAKDQELKVQYN